MSNLYDEAIADARSLKEMAERNARNKIIESITPRIRKLIERQILAEQEDEEIPNMDLDTPEDDADVEMSDPAAMPPAPQRWHKPLQKPPAHRLLVAGSLPTAGHCRGRQEHAAHPQARAAASLENTAAARRAGRESSRRTSRTG